MKVAYGLLGQDRKEMAMALGMIAGSFPQYKGVFSQAYQIGEEIQVHKDGAIDFGNTPIEEVKRMVKELKEKGYDPKEMPEELSDLDLTKAEEKKPDPEQVEEPAGQPEEKKSKEQLQYAEPKDYTVGISPEYMDEDAIENIRKIIESKKTLMKVAFGTDDLSIQVDNRGIFFPWFKTSSVEEENAYYNFVKAICEMAKNQERISAKERETDNQKYAFRCFLLRLGFIGDKYKLDRKILLRNLSGSSAFKSGERGESKNEISE